MFGHFSKRGSFVLFLSCARVQERSVIFRISEKAFTDTEREEKLDRKFNTTVICSSRSQKASEKPLFRVLHCTNRRSVEQE